MEYFTKILFILNAILAFPVFGQLTVETNKIVCDKSMQLFIEMARSNFNSIQLQEKALSINLNLIANCEKNFRFKANISANKDTLLLVSLNDYINETIGDSVISVYEEVIASCNCYFRLELLVKEIEKVPSVILVGKRSFSYLDNGDIKPLITYQELLFSVLNGLPEIPKQLPKNPVRLNRVDNYGNKIGIWKTKKNKITEYSHFSPKGKLKTEIDWRIIIYPEGQKRIEILSESGNWYLPNPTELKELRKKVKLIKRQNNKSISI